jgi:hypothetical protein
MLYKIINPSDPYTIEAHSLEVAATACLLLGNGQYAFEPIEGDGEKVPLLALGGSKEWFDKQFSSDADTVIGKVVRENKEELAECLDSCLIGNLGERELFFDATKNIADADERHGYWFAYHDKRRSSFNDIGGRAKKLAKKLRTGTTEKVDPVPQQVFTS